MAGEGARRYMIFRDTRSTLVLVPNPVPTCANLLIFHLSRFEKCSYSEKAQRFLTTTDLI